MAVARVLRAGDHRALIGEPLAEIEDSWRPCAYVHQRARHIDSHSSDGVESGRVEPSAEFLMAAPNFLRSRRPATFTALRAGKKPEAAPNFLPVAATGNIQRRFAPVRNLKRMLNH